MSMPDDARILAAAPLLLTLLVIFGAPQARSAGLPNLDAFAGLHGLYAPGGDCSDHPRITVDGDGLSVENGDSRYEFERFDHASNFGGVDYAGSSIWLMPLHGSERPILMTFNSGEQPGVLTVEPYDRGWAGGPPLNRRHQRLVDGSPYRRCGNMEAGEAPGQDPP
jgi:hypothetical protein